MLETMIMRTTGWGLSILLATAIAALPRPATGAPADPAMSPSEAAIRQADADWAEAAGTKSVDAWMTFYAAEAIVLAPDQPIASDPTLIRRAVGQLLALPHLTIAWHPVKVEVAAAGDLAYVVGAYELSYDDAHAGRAADRGKLLEVWRKQTDGRWKCIADTWNSDGAGGAPPAVRPVATPAPSGGALADSQGQGGEYGAKPVNYEATVRQYFQTYLTDPDSVRYQDISPPEKSSIKALSGAVFVRESTLKGWTVKVTLDAKNSHGVYVGFKTYSFLFRGEKIVHTLSPLTGDEIK